MEEPSKEFQARKEFLLHQARRTRMRFVLQARDITKIDNLANLENRNQKETDLSSEVNSISVSAGTATKLAKQNKSKVPAAECVQQVLDFFYNLLTDDMEAIDVDQLLLSVQDTDAEEDLRNFQETVGSGTLSDFDLFLRKLLLPQAAHIVKLLQRFVLKIQSRYRNLQLLPTSVFGLNMQNTAHDKSNNEKSSYGNGPLKADEVWDFIDHICQAMQESELWASGPGSSILSPAKAFAKLPAGSTVTSRTSMLLPLDSSVEVFVERFVFRKIGDYIFAGDKAEAQKNQQTEQRIQTLQFVTAEHLDIRSFEGYSEAKIAELIFSSSAALGMLTQHSAPSDKVVCLRNCCQQVALLLKQLKMERDKSSSGNAFASLPGADELLPMMIYVVLKTHIPQLHSQIRFLQSYIRPKQMLSEAGYLVTQFVSAVYFLDNVDASALMIEPDAFDSAMLQAKERAKYELLLQQQQTLISGKKQTNLSSGKVPSNPAEALDLENILSHYKAEMKSIEQSLFFAESVGSTVSQNSFPSLREYRTKYHIPGQGVKR